MIHRLAYVLRDEFLAGRYCALHVATREELGDFEPVPDQCHENARRYVIGHPGHKVVEGWLPAGDPPFLFDRHSVVENPAGQLICVTLGPQKKSAQNFIVHRDGWTEEPFARLPDQVQTSVLSY